MGIEFQVESLDKVGEDIRGVYVEAEGKFNFDPDKYAELKAAGLKKKTTELLGKVKEKETELAKYGKFKSLAEALAESDEEEIGQVLEHWQKRGENGKGGKPDPKTDEALQLKEKLHAKELKKRDDELTTLRTDHQKAQAELKDFKLWTPLRDVAIKAGLDPADWEVARLELNYLGRFGFDEDGKVVVIEDGAPSTVTPEKFFKDVYSDMRPKFYKANGVSGSGAQNQNKGGAGGKTVKRSDWNGLSPAEQDKKISEGYQIVD